MEAGSVYPPHKPLFEYFLACWKRVTKFRILRAPTPEKEEALKEAKRLCFSNCIFAITMPEMFGYLSPMPLVHFALTDMIRT